MICKKCLEELSNGRDFIVKMVNSYEPLDEYDERTKKRILLFFGVDLVHYNLNERIKILEEDKEERIDRIEKSLAKLIGMTEGIIDGNIEVKQPTKKKGEYGFEDAGVDE